MRPYADRQRPRARIPRVLPALGLLVLNAALAIGAPLDRVIDREIGATNLADATIGIHITELGSGRVLGSHNPDTALIPASNMKILTTGAALLTLGDGFAFETKVRVASRSGRTTLVIEGSGDPALGDREFSGAGSDAALTHDDLFDAVARALKKRSIDRVDEVVVDDRVFDREWAHPCWPADQLNRWYCAEVGGLNFHTNVISVFPSPRTPGSVPSVRTEPEIPWFEFTNEARSVRTGRSTVWLARPTPENRFTIKGNVRGRVEIPVCVHEPPRVAGEVFALALEERGIRVGSGAPIPERVRLATPGENWGDSTTVAIVRTPLDDVLRRANTDSHNLYTEALLKRIGHEVTGDPGSWSNGATVVRMLLSEKLGPTSAQTARIHDGSGMCRKNRLTPRILTDWLATLSREDAWETYIGSFAKPGEGTLRRRFDEEPLSCVLSAKSGYLDGVYALSGILSHPHAPDVAFSIILNDVRPGAVSRRAKPFIDEIVRAIDDWITQAAPTPGG